MEEHARELSDREVYRRSSDALTKKGEITPKFGRETSSIVAQPRRDTTNTLAKRVFHFYTRHKARTGHPDKNGIDGISRQSPVLGRRGTSTLINGNPIERR